MKTEISMVVLSQINVQNCSKSKTQRKNTEQEKKHGPLQKLEAESGAMDFGC